MIRAWALCVLAASAAVAQVERSDGAQAPALSFALQDDGAALSGNPGGLAFVSGLELDLLHNGISDPGLSQGHDEALLASAGIGPLAAGYAHDWLSRNGSGSHRNTFGAALRLGILGVGGAYRTRPGGFSSWDVGALARPMPFLSLAAAAVNADEPSTPAGTVPRRWTLAMALRPEGGRFDFAADMRWSQCTAGAFNCGISHRDLFFTGDVVIADGVRLLGQFGSLDTGELVNRRYGMVGLSLDLSHLGVTWGPRFASGIDTQADWRMRVSSEKWPAVQWPFGHAALIDLGKALRRGKPSLWDAALGGSTRDPLEQTLAALRRLSRDPRVNAVVLQSGGLPLGLGRAEELRQGIEGLRRAGKKVLFYLESAGDLEYSVATSADRIYSAPQAVLLVNGFAATAMFAAAGLDKLGVKAEFFRVGAYKNAPDLFTRSGMSSEQREVENSLLDDLFGRYVKAVSERRHLEAGKVRSLLDKGIVSPAQALQAGLVDGLVYPDQLEAEVGKVLGNKTNLVKTEVEPEDVREVRWGLRRKIEVVRVEGDIVRGEGVRDPFGAVEVVGSDAITHRIRRAADDPQVAAIVVRIDSPGGDATASDLIWRELVRARKEKGKPVIASMGDTAASGGYYVAAGADEILAEPSTITGSIGVFLGHFDASALFDKLGLQLITMKRGESADIFNPDRSLTDEERKTLQAWVDESYDTFLDRVAQARNMQKPEVDEIGRGRVWTGAQALDRRLIDRFGSLGDAIATAKVRSGALDAEVVDESPLSVELADLAGVSMSLPAGIAPRALRALRLLGEPGAVRAALPYDLEVH